MKTEHKLIGLNRKTRTGVYVTAEKGVEDWFHADLDEQVFSIQDQYALFDAMKNDDNATFKGATCVVENDKVIAYDIPYLNKIFETV